MFIKFLKIERHGEVIRNVAFHKGLNLIVDETKTPNAQESGNNVGKTTVLKLVDFCLGGSGHNIYQDNEFKEKGDLELEDYLKSSLNSILITLCLKDDLSDELSKELVIKRNFLSRKNKIQEINGQQFTNDEFVIELKKEIFKLSSDKPTFRQLIAKSIRYEKLRIDNTIKILHPSTTFEEYEALYFFWFGIDTDTANRKQKAQMEKSAEEAVLKRLKRETSLSLINQAISVLDNDIEKLNKAKASFNVNREFENDLQRLNNVKAKISRLSTELGRLEIRRDIILETQSQLQAQKFNSDVNELREMYDTAHALIPALQTSFEQLVDFHNSMLNEKVSFIMQELPALDQDIKAKNEVLEESLVLEADLASTLDKLGAMDGLEDVIKNLNLKYQQRGRYEEQLRQWNNAVDKLAEKERELEEINSGISSSADELDKGIALFNKFFSKISEKLYGEQFILSQSHNGRAYQLDINSLGGLGTGKKKGITAAFDIAYVEFCDAKGISCLHFVLHDQVESIHDNQLNLLAEVSSEANVQFVVSVLRDKLPVDINPDQYKVLSLSQNDKLFKVK